MVKDGRKKGRLGFPAVCWGLEKRGIRGGWAAYYTGGEFKIDQSAIFVVINVQTSKKSS